LRALRTAHIRSGRVQKMMANKPHAPQKCTFLHTVLSYFFIWWCWTLYSSYL